jgi:hypothetical protein
MLRRKLDIFGCGQVENARAVRKDSVYLQAARSAEYFG